MSVAKAVGPHHAVKLVGDNPCQLSYPGVVGLSDRRCKNHGPQKAVTWDGNEICLGCVEDGVEAFDDQFEVCEAFAGCLQPDDQTVWRSMATPAAALHKGKTSLEDMTKRHLVFAAILQGKDPVELLQEVRFGRGNAVICMMYHHAM